MFDTRLLSLTLLVASVVLGGCEAASTRSVESTRPIPSLTTTPITQVTVVLTEPVRAITIPAIRTPVGRTGIPPWVDDAIVLVHVQPSGPPPQSPITMTRSQRLAVLFAVRLSNYNWGVQYDQNILELDPQINPKQPPPNGWLWMPKAKGQTEVIIEGVPVCLQTSPPCSLPNVKTTFVIQVLQ